MRVLVAGAEGLVGREVVARLGQKAIGRGRGALDITCPASVERALDETGARVVINAAAMTHVDACEVSPREAFLVNAEGPRILADALARRGGALIHLSTDYVFGGPAAGPRTLQCLPQPENLYGCSKWAGEAAIRAALDRHVILRTSWVFGPAKPGFVGTVLGAAQKHGRVQVVDPQRGAPTPAAGLVEAILAVLADLPNRPWGTWHVVGQPFVDRVRWAEAILHAAGVQVPVSRVPWGSFGETAQRPEDTRLDPGAFQRRFGVHIDWRQHLDATVEALTCLA